MNYSMSRLGFRPICGFVVALLILIHARAQEVGVIEGRVLNLAAGTYLDKARVRVEGTTFEAFTNEIGEYRLANVPAGNVRVTVSFTDMQPESTNITVTPGRVVQQDFNLLLTTRSRSGPTKDPLVLDAFTVSDRALSAQASAVQQQKTAPNIMNVVTFEEFGDLGEGNPGEFLKFVPGIEISLAPVVASLVTMRGMPPDGTLLMFDGVQYATTQADSRAADLISTNMGNVERIEVTKVPTPDSPANAVGGMINIIPKSNFSLTRKEFTYNAFIAMTTKEPLDELGSQFTKRMGTSYRDADRRLARPGFDFTYMLPVNKSLALSLSGGYSDRVELRDFLNATWNHVTFVQTAGQKNPTVIPRVRRSLSGTADFKLGKAHRFSAGLQYTDDEAYSFLPNFTYAYGAGVTGGENFSQGAPTAVGVVTQNIQKYNQIKENVNGRFRYTYTGNAWKANVNIGLSRSQFNTKTLEDGTFRTVTATLSNVVLRADGLGGIRDQTPPRLTGVTAGGAPVDVHNGDLFTLGTATGVTIPLKNNAQTAKVDVVRDWQGRIPFSLKAGLAFDRTERDIRSQTWSWTINPPAAAGGRLVGNHDLIDEVFTNNWTYRDGSKVRWIDSQKVFQMFKEHPEYFQLNEAAAHTSGVTGSKQLEEVISAAFMRADVKLFNNRLLLVGGARFERTDDEGLGPLNDPGARFRKDAAGNFVRGADGRLVPVTTDALQIAQLQYVERGTRVDNSYHGIYPSLNSTFSITDSILARAAYARTIGRPALSQILPGVSITDISTDNPDPVINETNIGLEPWHADNLDLSFEFYNVKGAIASVSLFRKDISKFFSNVRRAVTPEDLARYGLTSDYSNYDLVTTSNSNEEATIDGIEWSWRQSLRPFSFVPGWAKGLEAYVNKTRLHISGVGSDNFVPFRPRLLNWGLAYSHRKAVVRVNVAQQGEQKTAVANTSATTPPGTYQYLARRAIVDVSFEYRFYKQLAVYGSARNLFQNPRRFFRTAPNAPEYTRPLRYDYYGALLTFGIKGTF